MNKRLSELDDPLVFSESLPIFSVTTSPCLHVTLDPFPREEI